ncbi:unnamed protein product [Heligmosomoides polygyrus]|uniref:RNase H domain-containing protein n=1 Tax=Heligmosomoides polygyrus TaxID=6339 RepID=A0A183G4F0_HELPZ|nr:unnamed protein product [Heligmosomoides polygyrus]
MAREILGNTYVDNILIGATTPSEGLLKQRQCKKVFEHMGMNLREFMSNSNTVLNPVLCKDRMKKMSSAVKLLGLRWNPEADTIHAFASTFDPLGLLTPIFIKARVFIQDLWLTAHSWDDLSDQDLITMWNRQVPRFIGIIAQSTHDLVIFSDASQRVYSAVAYLVCRPNSGGAFSNLAFSKAKLASKGGMTIPRLELMAIVLATKLARFLYKELNMHINSLHLLSDSQVALFWIHSQKPLKTFVQNRAKFINQVLHELEKSKISSRFHYVETDSNPADCATRGLYTSELKYHIWWDCPKFTIQQNTHSLEIPYAIISMEGTVLKTIHRRTLDLWNFQTLISEIGATLNTRPITPVLTNATEEGCVTLRPIDLISP